LLPTGVVVTSDQFLVRLAELTAEEIRHIAALRREDLGSAEGELTWWRATLTVSGALRRRHLTRPAGLAAHQASTAVMEAGQALGMAEDERDDLIAVARAAGEVARALVATGQNGIGDALTALLHPWHDTVAA
jgi:hypothetical protein